MVRTVRRAVGTGRYRVSAEAVAMGEDLVVRVEGGTTPHVGAVAVSMARPSLADSSKISSSTSLITLPGHKEDGLALQAAGELTAASGKTAVVVAGIHIDNATPEEITMLVNNAKKALAAIVKRVLAARHKAPGDTAGGLSHPS
jgi:hypothetical protein